jgi:hypothetical protein
VSATIGATIKCDRYVCDRSEFGDTLEQVRDKAVKWGWSRTEDGRDFCPNCTEIRAKRKKPGEFAPAGVKVRRVFDAAEAAGWEKRDHDEATGNAHFFCCEKEVDVDSFLGAAYQAKCSVCGSAIASVLAPAFGRSSVAFLDSDKVDVEDPEHWVVVSEFNAASAPDA